MQDEPTRFTGSLIMDKMKNECMISSAFSSIPCEW